ncbi:hypothetical protein TSAR_002468 [Trichomalopsis sarcophagae]|uniref:Uncharacterized protein n=1 Tax=Trichomalopsis sarcophagae TaxID=543379 RepID=A0A232F6Q9_9HYME|nr:hypothetical protein TSAR_002468 [Trichomalopsis sarcophagae]
MSEVIVLSSSEDEAEIVSSKRSKNDKSEDRESINSDFSLSDFPQINFNDIHSNVDLSGNNGQEENCSFSDIPEVDNSRTKAKTSSFEDDSFLSNLPKFNVNRMNNLGAGTSKDEEDCASGAANTNAKSSNSQDGSQSDSDYESQNNLVDYWAQYMDGLKSKYNVKVDLSSDEDNELEEAVEKEKEQRKKRSGGKKAPTKSKAEAAEEKKRKQEERQQEKLRKQEEAAKQKALKELNKKNRLQFNPENSLKSMKILFDEEIAKYDFYTDVLRNAEEYEVQYNVQSQLIPKSITWNRKVEDNYINDKHEVCSTAKQIDEDQLMIIWDAKETVNHISNDTFISAISNVKSLLPDKKLTLVMYKIESYFKYIKSIKDRAVREDILSSQGNQQNQKKSKTKADRTFANFPKISRDKFEDCLVEIQLLYKANSRLIELPCEMVLLIHQYTKSLAQRPSKLEKRQESSQNDWYVSCDNRDTVKVDKDGNGLKRLWQQQLCQFTLMSLESAEAIVSVYKSPLQLMEAYSKCSPAEGETLLKDIPIRRAVGPLTSTRKIGPELSKKIFTMFTAEDGDLLNE